MEALKRVAREWCPPALRPMVQKAWSVASGRGLPQSAGLGTQYPSWNAAVDAASGYSTAAILEAMTSAAAKAAQSNGYLFDRDGHVFDVPIIPFPLLCCLLKAAGDNELHVVDFGGALGSTYRQCLPFLSQIGQLRWSVVEQPAFVRSGTERFRNEQLQFFETLEQASRRGRVNAVIFSGVLQYLDEPYKIIRQALDLDPVMIVVDRNPFTRRTTDIFTVQLVPGQPFAARLPFRAFGAQTIEKAIGPRYRKITEFAAVDPEMRTGNDEVRFIGQAFERVAGNS